MSMPSDDGGRPKGKVAAAIFPGISVDRALLKIAVLIARPTVPPKERVAIIRADAIEISSGGVHNCAATIIRGRIIPSPTPKMTPKPQNALPGLEPEVAARQMLKMRMQTKPTVMGIRSAFLLDE